jgi:hypothetical protein
MNKSRENTMKPVMSKNYGAVLILLISFLVSACSSQLNVDVQGQINEEQGSGIVDLDIGVGESGASEQSNANQDSGESSSGQQNEPLLLQSDSLLILLGLGLLVMVSLFIALLRLKQDDI